MWCVAHVEPELAKRIRGREPWHGGLCGHQELRVGNVGCHLWRLLSWRDEGRKPSRDVARGVSFIKLAQSLELNLNTVRLQFGNKEMKYNEKPARREYLDTRCALAAAIAR